MEKSNHSNTINKIKVVLLRTPMVVPKWAHASSICPPLGLAYVAASLQQAKYEIRCVDALGEAPLQKIISENNNFVNIGLSTTQIIQHLALQNFDILFISLMFSHGYFFSAKK